MKSKNQTTVLMTVLAVILVFALPVLSEDKWEDEMQALIQGKAKMELLREQAIKDGMTTLMQDGIRKVFVGQTDIQQVRKVCIK